MAGLGLALMVAASVLAQAPDTYPGMPPVPDRNNVYSETGVGKLSPAVAQAVPRVYVPHVTSSDVYVIDPTTLKVLYSFPVGRQAQHVVPSYDLKTLWVASVGDRRTPGSLTPIDPTTGAPGADGRRRRSLQSLFHARRRLRHRGCGEAAAPRLSRSPHHGAEIFAPRAAMPRRQSRRLLDRRALRHLHLRVQRLAREDRHDRPQRHELSQALPRRHAAGHPHLARRATCSSSPTCMRMASSSSMPRVSPRRISSTPAPAPTAFIPAATAPSSM